MPACAPCTARGHDTPLDAGHCCPACADRLDADLRDIPLLAMQARDHLTPTRRGTHRPGYGSRPVINLDATDPELALIELNPGDPSSAVTLLACLEMWEIVVRDARQLAPYGPASARRTRTRRARITPTLAAFLDAARFLRRQHPWLIADPGFSEDLPDLADHARRVAATLRRWNTDRDPPGWGLHCPTTRDDGAPCGQWIRWDPDTSAAHCHRCGRDWDTAWLLRVADDVWLDADAIEHLTGTPRRTLQHWARAGKVAKRGQLYRLTDIPARGRSGHTGST
jgi:hypothetical protein